jgi:hypothetical protein
MSKSMPSGALAGCDAASPRTPRCASSMSLDGAHALSPSPSIQRISLLGKAEAQNIEIQLKGIKMRLPAITAVRLRHVLRISYGPRAGILAERRSSPDQQTALLASGGRCRHLRVPLQMALHNHFRHAPECAASRAHHDVQGVRDVDVARFKQKDVDFIAKLTENIEVMYTTMEEAAVQHGGLDDVAPRLGVAERFLYELWQVPRLHEKLAVLEFWHSYADECGQVQVRPGDSGSRVMALAQHTCAWRAWRCYR